LTESFVSSGIVSAPSERRRLQRAKLLEPLAGRIGAQRVFILDVSRTGMRVAHREAIGAPGDHCVEGIPTRRYTP